MPQGARFALHKHSHHQLAWASSGVLTLSAADSTWVLPTSRGLWIPAGLPHAVDALVPATMHGLYLEPATCAITWTSPTVIAVDGLLRELIRHLARNDLPPDARRRAETVIFDVIEPLSVTTIVAPMPADTRARRVADALLANPADQRSVESWGRVVGASGRTLARLFTEETGLSFGQWRAQVRLRAALHHLACGLSVTSVAGRVGYSTPSAFVAMFRRITGVTPAAYFAGNADDDVSTRPSGMSRSVGLLLPTRESPDVGTRA